MTKPLPSSSNLNVMVVSQYCNVQVGGAERYIREICSRLEANHALELTYLSSDLEPTLLSAPPYRLLTTGFHPAWFSEVERTIEAAKPDILYIHHTVPGLTDLALRSARRLRIPVALMYHGDVTGAEPLKKFAGLAYHTLFGKASLRVPQVLFVSSLAYVQRSPFLRTLATRFVEAPPGVDPVMLGGRRSRSRCYLLFVGKPDVKSKGFEVLRQAWERLRATRPNLDLVVVGDHANDTVLVPKQEGIHYVGQVTSRQALADYYASAEVTVLPSTSTAESFGMVLAEALLAGCPIVGSDVGGIPDLIEHGKNGYLVPRGDVEALTSTLDLALEQQAKLRQYIVAQRHTQAERFSWDHSARVVAQTLLETAGRTSVGLKPSTARLETTGRNL